MVQVVLVRHGHPLVEGENAVAWTLSDEGRQAASALAGAKIWEAVRRIYVSPEPKARQTAEIISGGRAPVEVKEGLREVRRPFEATGYDDKIRAFLKGEAPPGWEDREEAGARVRQAIEEMHKGGVDVGAVSHGLLLTLFVAGVMGAEPTFWLHHSIGFAEFAVYDTSRGTLTRGFRAPRAVGRKIRPAE